MAENTDFPEPRPPGPDRRDNVASAGLDPDTWEELEEWRTENRLKRSEAVRRIIRAGLDAQDDDGWRDRAGRVVGVLAMGGYPAVVASSGRLDLAAAWLAIISAAVFFEPWLRRLTSGLLNPLSYLK